MSTLDLLQLGDIHFPDSRHETSDVDMKDPGSPGHWRRQLSTNLLTEVVQQVVELLETRPSIRGVLVVGDLTSRSDLKGYEECVDYLFQALRLDDVKLWNNRELHVVPGNHDVQRGDCDHSGVDGYRQFEKLRQVWADRGFDLTVDQVRSTNLSVSDGEAAIHSLNSCMGCGVHRFIPEEVRTNLLDALAPFLAKPSDSAAFDLVAEQLDTPIIAAADLEELERRIRLDSHHVLPVVLGHHGILPQWIPRVALYTELLNSGHVRARLSTLPRAVLYCHGHVHEDPTEVITQPQHERARLVTIAAPKLVQGFNLIRLWYSRRRSPIGCEILPYRVHSHGGIRLQPSLRVPLVTRVSAARVADELAISVLNATQQNSRFHELLREVRSKDGMAIPEAELRAVINELEWGEAVEVRNRDEESNYWLVHRI